MGLTLGQIESNAIAGEGRSADDDRTFGDCLLAWWLGWWLGSPSPPRSSYLGWLESTGCWVSDGAAGCLARHGANSRARSLLARETHHARVCRDSIFRFEKNDDALVDHRRRL